MVAHSLVVTLRAALVSFALVVPAYGQTDAAKINELCAEGRAVLDRNLDRTRENSRELKQLLQLYIEMSKQNAPDKTTDILKAKADLLKSIGVDIATKQIILIDELENIGCKRDKWREQVRQLYMEKLVRRQ